VARIGAPHGVRGEVKLWPFTGEPMAVLGYGPLASEDGTTTIRIEALRPQGDFLVARLHGIADRSAAEKLRNVELYVARDLLPGLEEEGEFYHADLVGLTVTDRSGGALGTVAAIHNFGAGDLLEVRPAAGGPTVLLPFTKTVVPVVDVAQGRIVAEPPAGTFAPASPEPPGAEEPHA
jgi:16S rRNA processing protein RimM